MDRLEKQILCISTVCLIFIFLFALYWLPTLPHKESDNEKTGVEAATEMAGTSPQVPTQSMCSEETDAAAPEQETWKISVLNTANGKQKFQFTLEDYIEKYNFLYRLEHDRTWLLPKEEWHRFDSQESPFSDIDTARYEFDPDKNVHSDPDWWIAKVTSGLHDLLPVTEKSCKTKFRISWAGNKNPEVNFTNIAETRIYSCKGN